MEVVIAGGRDNHISSEGQVALNKIRQTLKIKTVITGGARGIDTDGALWADNNQLNKIIDQAEWDKYGKRAGYLRNLQMANRLVKSGGVLIVFKGGKGTHMMISIAKEKLIPIIDLTDDRYIT